MTATEDRYDRLAQETEREHAEAWRPNAGDVLVGEYVRRDAGVSSYDGRSHPILVLKDRNGVEHAVWCFHAVLRERLAALKPKVGELVAVRYKGKRQGANAAYHDYAVEIEREGAADDWDAQDGDAEFAVNGDGESTSAQDDGDIPF
jgi:hypothetical protein